MILRKGGVSYQWMHRLFLKSAVKYAQKIYPQTINYIQVAKSRKNHQKTIDKILTIE